MYQELQRFGRVKTNEPLAKHTTFKIGGPADFFVVAEDKNNLVALLRWLDGEGAAYFILGGGSNLLVRDEGYRGVAVNIKNAMCEVNGALVTAGAGCVTVEVARQSIQAGLTGFEWGVGVPGTIGGAVRGNAGAMGQDISKNIQKVEVWQDGEIKELSREECGFIYRGSDFKNDPQAVILRVWLALAKGEVRQILATVQENLKQREGKFPPYPSAGCFFKNVKLDKWPGHPKDLPTIFLERGTVPAGWLIDQAGARGLLQGGAAVSDKHCNFVINKDKASQADVLAVVEEVRTRVYNKFKVELELEVEIIK